jgi:hypothetical protein
VPVCTGTEATLSQCNGWEIDGSVLCRMGCVSANDSCICICMVWLRIAGLDGKCMPGDEIGIDCAQLKPAPVFGSPPYCNDNLLFNGTQPPIDPLATPSGLNCDQTYYRAYLNGDTNGSLSTQVDLHHFMCFSSFSCLIYVLLQRIKFVTMHTIQWLTSVINGD